MKKKSVFLATLCLAMATTGVTAFASSNDTPTERVVSNSNLIPNPFVEDQLISPMVIDTNNPIGGPVTGGAVVPKQFSINAGYGHIKLFMKNYSNQSVTVSLTHEASGAVYFNRVIAAHGELTWKNFEEGFEQGMRAGGYRLQWSGGGSNVNGEFFGKTGSSISDVTN